jgi:hypothetical protein
MNGFNTAKLGKSIFDKYEYFQDLGRVGLQKSAI